MRALPPEFDLDLFEGQRREHHPRREDAFQQIVGDVLQELHGFEGVHVAATRGPDGGIDIHSEGGLLGLPGPSIVEAKDQDPTGKSSWDNLLGQWRSLAEKLRRAAARGWEPPFDPWTRARSYVYCVSLRLNQSRREGLEARIREFFDGLGDAAPPLLERIAVWDWADVRGWLADAPRTADAWVGLGEPRLLTHRELRREQAQGFRRFLLEEELPYLPLPDAERRPGRVLERLRGLAGRRGMVVAGPGGAGKTRLAMEVATLAHDQGCRVLHARPGEPHLTTDNLARAVLAGAEAEPSSTLLVLDYLDQMEGLDLGRIHRWLLPEAAERGVELMLLATARPGEADPEVRKALFEELELRPDEAHADRLSRLMLSTVAPLAWERLGQDVLARLCGQRPILALLTALEVERRVHQGGLAAEELEGLRSQDLLYWLRSRLKYGGLEVPPAAGLRAVEAEPGVVAAAAVLASAPQRETELVEVAALVSGRPDLGEFVLQQLLEMGWLERRGQELATPHDVVADEVLDQVLRRRPSTVLRKEALSLVLKPAAVLPRTLGRMGLAFRRLLGMEDHAPDLEPACGEWLEAHAGEAGEVLAPAPSDEAAYALGSVLSGPPWLEPALACWDRLVGPWLTRHGLAIEARHLLYRGLKHLPKDGAEALSKAAVAWVEAHVWELEGSFVLAPLLNRDDLAGEESSKARGRALEWLGRHGLELEAEFVLQPLLDREDLAGEESSAARGRALEWLERHGLEPEAGFVLRSLLDREDLAGEESSEARGRALEWLGRHGLELEAQFVLHSILDRKDLAGEESSEARGRALEWLGRLGLALEAQFVLHSILDRKDLAGEESSAAQERALEWLGSLGLELDAGFVLPPLLARKDLAGEESSEARGRALEWLGRHGLELEAQFVLHSILDRNDLAGEESSAARGRAQEWLRRHGLGLDAGFVLPPLLARKDLEDQEGAEACTVALAWLGEHLGTQEAEFVLGRLLLCRWLPPEDRSTAAELSVRLLDSLIERSGEVTFLLRNALMAKGLPSELDAAVLGAAFRWVRSHPLHEAADFALTRILRRRDLPDTDWQEAASLALAWLRSSPHATERDFLLNSLFRRDKLLAPDEREWLLGDSRAWLDAFDPDVRSLGGLRGNVVSRELSAHLFGDDGVQLTPGQIAQRAEEARSLLLRNELVSAGYYLAPLLPATASKGLLDVHRQVFEDARRLLMDPRFDGRARHGFGDACHRLLDEGAWPDRTLGEKALAGLGLGQDTPSPATGQGGSQLPTASRIR